MSKTLHQEATLDRARRSRPAAGPVPSAAAPLAPLPASPPALTILHARSEVRLPPPAPAQARRARIDCLTWSVVIVGGIALAVRWHTAAPRAPAAPFEATRQVDVAALPTAPKPAPIKAPGKDKEQQAARERAIVQALLQAEARTLPEPPAPPAPPPAPIVAAIPAPPPVMPPPVVLQPVVVASQPAPPTASLPVSVRRMRPTWPEAASLPTPRKDALAIARPAQL